MTARHRGTGCGLLRLAAQAAAAALLLVAGVARGAPQDEKAPAPPSPPAEEQGPIALRVLVTEIAGKPVVSAEVRVTREGKEPAAWKTDATGAAVVTGIPRRSLPIDVAAAGFVGAAGTLHAGAVDRHPEKNARAFVREWTPAPPTVGGPATVRVVLARAREVRIEGAPPAARIVARVVATPLAIERMPGADVRMLEQGGEHLVATIDRVADGDGTCALQGVPEHATVVVRAEAPGSASRAVAEEIGEDDEDPTITLAPATPAWTASGTVRDAAGKPAAGARIHAAPDDAPLALADPTRPPESGSRDRRDVPLAWTVLADAQGAWTLPHLERGRKYALRAECGDAMSLVTWGATQPEAADTPLRIDFVVAPPASLAGRVVDDEGTVPAGGEVRLVALPRDDGVERRAALEEGAFRFGNLLPGCYRLLARGRGFRPVETEIDVPRAGELLVTVKSGATIVGRVVDLEGNPVAGALVQAFDPAVEALQVIRTPFGEQGTESDADGGFRLAGLTPRRWHVRVYAGDAVASVLVPTDAPARGLVVRVGPRPRLRYTLALPEGVTMRQVKFGVFRLVGDGTPYRAGAWDQEALGERTAAFKDLPADEEVIVRFVVPGHPPYMRRFRLEPGEARDLGEIHPPKAHVLEGVVRDSSGKPFRGVTVRAELCENEAETDDEGRFRLECVGEGEQEVDLSSFGDGFALGESPVKVPSAKPVELVLLRSADVRVRVTDEDGNPVQGSVVIHAVRPWGKLRRPDRETLDPDGEFSASLTPGPHRVAVFGGGSDEPLAVRMLEVTERMDDVVEIVVLRVR